MDILEKIIRENCWKFDKGYPDSQEDINILKSLVKSQLQEQEEDELAQLKAQLIKTIQDADDLDDKEIRAYIKSINNRGYKNNLTQKLADKGYTADRFKFGEKALDKINKDVDSADLSVYFDYLKNPKSLKDIKPAGKFHEELGLPQELVKSFVDIEPGADQGGSSIGKAELFLSLFFDDIGNTADKIDPETGEIKKAKGDNSWQGVGNLEVKGTGGRLGQQAGRGLDAVSIFKTLVSDLLPEDRVDSFISEHDQYYTMSKSISALYKEAKENGVGENEIQSKIIDALDKVYWNQGMASNYFKTEKDFTDLEEITKNLLKLNAESYSKVKGVDAILFIDTAAGQNKYIIVKKEDYNDTIDNKKFWTTTKAPTGYQWKNVNPNLIVGNV
jgi:hypothetical protein